MMQKSRKETVEEYCRKLYDGEIEFSDIRKELEAKYYDEEDIKVILNRVDRDMDRKAFSRAEKSSGKQMFVVGLAIMIAGIFVTVATYTGYIDLGDSFIIAYGPAIGGLGLAAIGALKMNS